MMNLHPIYIIDDDIDDKEIVQEVWNEIGLENKLVFFNSGDELIERLNHDTHNPFLIICDINLPRMNGFEIREKLLSDPETRYKTVPFIFWSNSASKAQIKKAYDLAAHGMFIKGSSMEELKKTFTRIVEYWQVSLKP
jgi:CheY-like chemotaxis protein